MVAEYSVDVESALRITGLYVLGILVRAYVSVFVLRCDYIERGPVNELTELLVSRVFRYTARGYYPFTPEFTPPRADGKFIIVTVGELYFGLGVDNLPRIVRRYSLTVEDVNRILDASLEADVREGTCGNYCFEFNMLP